MNKGFVTEHKLEKRMAVEVFFDAKQRKIMLIFVAISKGTDIIPITHQKKGSMSISMKSHLTYLGFVPGAYNMPYQFSKLDNLILDLSGMPLAKDATHEASMPKAQKAVN